MDKNKESKIAKQIIKHIEQHTDINIIKSWNGGTLPLEILDDEINGLPALTISINSNRHSGYVTISYDQSEDLYIVTMYDVFHNLIAEAKYIFGCNIGEVIEELIINHEQTFENN